MIFADSAFYTDVYLAGRAGIIPLNEFDFWARDATNRINWRKVVIAPDDIPEPLKLCTCEVAEAIFIDAEKMFMAMQPSQSVGAYSKGAANIRMVQGELGRDIEGIVRKHLSGTALHNDFVFRGG